MSATVSLQPIVTFPRRVAVGQTCWLTVDLMQAGEMAWPYDEEELVVSCMLESAPLFVNRPVQSAVVMHRFGGTYGPARWLLTAREASEGAVWITLVNTQGVAFTTVEVKVDVVDAELAESVLAEARVEWRRAGPTAKAVTGDEVVPEVALYVSAKVVLLGESQAGKTSLAMRLSEGRWELTESTIGAWAIHMPMPVPGDSELDREIWLWDFGGQADQRLIQQLYLADTALAVFVFDGQREDAMARLWALRA